MFTWGEIQLETCKKMFLNSTKITTDDLDDLRENNNYKTYFNGMAQAANEGIAEILKRGKPYVKTFTFSKKTTDNLLGNQLLVTSHETEDVVFEAGSGLAYYFEVNNHATIKIYVDNVLVDTIDYVPDTKNFEITKDFLSNSSNKPVKIVFTGSYPYQIRNVCIFGLNYNYGGENDIDNIPNYTAENIFDLKDLTEDFYKIVKFYYNGIELVNNTDYKMIDYYTISINNMCDGEYMIKYQPYVQKIDEDTSDDYQLPLEKEMAVLLPLYMASELYKDDDLAMSTIYRNEFEAAVDDTYPTMSDMRFTNKSGWC